MTFHFPKIGVKVRITSIYTNKAVIFTFFKDVFFLILTIKWRTLYATIIYSAFCPHVCCPVFLFPVQAIEKKISLVKDNSSNFTWSIYGETGIQHTDLHFNAPFVAGIVPQNLFVSSPLNLELHNADAWYGGIGTEFKIGRFSAFAEGKTTMPRQTSVGTDAEPFWGGMNPVIWNGNRLNWWAVNGGAGVDITSHFTIQAGLKFERLSLGLSNPMDSQGQIALFHDQFGDTYSGDLVSKLLIPWVGVRAQAAGLSGSLRFSPFAHVDLQIPFSYTTVLSATQVVVENENYSFEQNGMWLEANLAYDLYKGPSWTCSLWAQASWLWVYGDTLNTFQATRYQTGTPATVFLTNSSSVASSYYTGAYGIGLRVGYNLF